MRRQCPALAAVNAAVIGGASQKRKARPAGAHELDHGDPPGEADRGRAALRGLLGGELHRIDDGGGDRHPLFVEDDQAGVDITGKVTEWRIEERIGAQPPGKSVDQHLDPAIVGEQPPDRFGDSLRALLGESRHGQVEALPQGTSAPVVHEPVDRPLRGALPVPVREPVLELLCGRHVRYTQSQNARRSPVAGRRAPSSRQVLRSS